MEIGERAIIAQKGGEAVPSQVGDVLLARPPSRVHVASPIWHTTGPGEALGVQPAFQANVQVLYVPVLQSSAI